jgi:hypothetical protein
MFRRRRRRNSFARRGPPRGRFVLFGIGAVAFVGLFVFFMRQADVLAPAPHEIRVDLPDAFKE